MANYIITFGVLVLTASLSGAQAADFFTLREARHLPACDVMQPGESEWMRSVPTPSSDEVPCGSDATRVWSSIAVDEPSIHFSVDPGDWLHFDLASLPAGPAEMEVSGHDLVTLNGLNRPGLPLPSGQMRYPIVLGEGSNDLLVRAAKERLYVRIFPVDPENASARFWMYDRRLPFLEDLQNVDVVVGLVLSHTGDEPLTGVRIATKSRFEPLNDWADYPSDAVAGVWEYTDLVSVPARSMVPVAMRIVGPPPHKRSGIPYPVDIQLQRISDGAVLAETVVNLSSRYAGDHFRRTWIDRFGVVQECMTFVPAEDVKVASDVEEAPRRPVLVTLPSSYKSMIDTMNGFEPELQTDGIMVVSSGPRLGTKCSPWLTAYLDEAIERVDRSHAIDPDRLAVAGFADSAETALAVAQARPGLFSAVGMIGQEFPGFDDQSFPVNLETVDLLYRFGQFDHTVRPTTADWVERSRTGGPSRTVVAIEPDQERWWGAATIAGQEVIDFLLNGNDGHAPIETVDLVIDDGTRVHHRHGVEGFRRIDPSQPARVQLVRSGEDVSIETANLDALTVQGGVTSPREIRVDGEALSVPADSGPQVLHREDGIWAAGEKRPLEASGHADLFRRPLILVYGTIGDAATTRDLWGKARYDAENLWTLGNGKARILSDQELTPAHWAQANIVLYGTRQQNALWPTLLPDSPVQIETGRVTAHGRSWTGDSLTAHVLQPLPDDVGLVLAVASTGAPAQRRAARIPVTDPVGPLKDWCVLEWTPTSARSLAGGQLDAEWSIPDAGSTGVALGR